MTPARNCLKCEFYDKCEEFDDGRCLILTKKIKVKPRRNFFECNGKVMTLAEWARFLGVNRTTLQYQFYHKGVSAIKKALENKKAKGKKL